MHVDDLPAYLKGHWPRIREELRNGSYKPQPVKRITIPKHGGGERHLGLSTVVDRLIQQALLQVLQPEWDPTFSESSYGFRPELNAHQAVCAAHRFIRSERRWVVDMDLEKFFDRVNHDVLMHRVRQRIHDPAVVRFIQSYLKAGIMSHTGYHESEEGTPQGGTTLAAIIKPAVVDDLDKELERRGHSCARYADDCNIYVRNRKAGYRRLRESGVSVRLAWNTSKSAHGPWRLSHSPALNYAMPKTYFEERGLPSLSDW